MRLLSTAATLLALTCLSASSPSPSFLDSQSPIKVDGSQKSVHGDNPLTYCSEPESDILHIDTVDLTPNPPLPGRTLTIQANGTLLEDIEKGATVLLVVKYGLITILNGEVDLCNQIKNVDLNCPLRKGELTLTKKVDLPQQIPPGKYSVHADIMTKGGDRVTCLEAHDIEFKR